MDCSLPGSSIHGIFQARVLEWGAIAFSGYPFIGVFRGLFIMETQHCLANSLNECISVWEAGESNWDRAGCHPLNL